MKIQYIGLIALAAACVLSGCSKGMSNTAVADVDGVTISQKDFFDYLQHKPTMLVSTPSGAQVVKLAGTPGFQALKDLIINKIVEKMAKDEGVFPSDADVNKEIKFQESKSPQLVSNALAQGISIDMLRDEVRNDLCKFNLVTKGVTVTPEQVNQYITANQKTKFMNPPQANLQMVAVHTKDDEKAVDAALAKGQQFAAVAQTYSIDPNGAASQWHFGITNVTQMPPALQALVAKTPVLHTTDWVQFKDGLVKFYVESKQPASEMKITDVIKEEVRRQLMLQQGSQAVDLDKRVQQALVKSIANIKVLNKADDQEWKNFVNAVEQSPNASTGVTAPGTAPGQKAPAGTGAAPAAGAPAAGTPAAGAPAAGAPAPGAPAAAGN